LLKFSHMSLFTPRPVTRKQTRNLEVSDP